jgi:hypothetical protein
MMKKKLLIVSASLLCVAGFISMAWAHGPGGSGFGYRSYSYSTPHFSRPSHSRIGGGFRQHPGHSRYGSLPYSKRGHLRRSRQSHRLPRIENGIILGKPGPIQSKTLRDSRTKSFSPGFGVGPLRKALQRKGLQQGPRHTPSSHIYFSNNPEPWFLYGKGKEFRQMGLIPPLPQTSQKLK